MALIGKDRLALHVADPVRVPLEDYGFGKDDYILVRPLSAKHMLEVRMKEGVNPELGNLGFVYNLLHRVLVDESNVQLYSSATEMQEGFDLPFKCMEFIAQEALRISGVETLEKN